MVSYPNTLPFSFLFFPHSSIKVEESMLLCQSPLQLAVTMWLSSGDKMKKYSGILLLKMWFLAALTSLGAWSKCAISGSTPDLQYSNLCFKKIPRWYLLILSMHFSRGLLRKPLFSIKRDRVLLVPHLPHCSYLYCGCDAWNCINHLARMTKQAWVWTGLVWGSGKR